MAEMPGPAQPAQPASPAFRASKIAVFYLNSIQKRTLLLVQSGGSPTVPSEPRSLILAGLPDQCNRGTRQKSVLIRT